MPSVSASKVRRALPSTRPETTMATSRAAAAPLVKTSHGHGWSQAAAAATAATPRPWARMSSPSFPARLNRRTGSGATEEVYRLTALGLGAPLQHDPQLLHAAIEGLAADAEAGRGLRHAAAGVEQHALDLQPLGAGGLVSPVGGREGRPRRELQVVGAENGAGCDQRRALDAVHQLADVSRPRILQERGARLGRQRARPAAAAGGERPQ